MNRIKHLILLLSLSFLFLFIKTAPAYAIVSDVTFTATTYEAGETPVWTITLKANVSPLRSSGDTIRVDFPTGFDITQVVKANITLVSGFAEGATIGTPSKAGQRITFQTIKTGANSLEVGSLATFTITNIPNPGPGVYAATDFGVHTNRESNIVNPPSDVTITGAIAPIVVTNAATSITATTATLNGTISDGGEEADVTFEYGTDPTLSSGTTIVTAAQSPITGNLIPVSYVLSGLTTETTYYYRTIGENSAGSTNGSILSFTASVSPRYWIGNGGNWSDTAHWSLISGGSGGASVPQYTNDARFDSNSFSSSGQTVALDTDAITKDLNWTGVLNSPTFSVNNRTLTINGSLMLAANMTITGSFTDLIFDSSTTNTITMAGNSEAMLPNGGLKDTNFRGTGTWTLMDEWTDAHANVLMIGGTLNTNNQYVLLRQIYDGYGQGVPSGVLTANFTASTMFIVDGISFTNEGSTLIASSANMIHEPDIDWTIISVKAGTTFASIYGKPGLNTGSIWHMSDDVVSVGTLTLDPAGESVYELSGMTINNLVSNGSTGNLVKVTQNIVASSQIATDYISVASSTCSGVTPCYAGSHSFDGGGNSGWVFTAAPPALTTSAASAITTTTATLNGAANGKGDSTPVTFIYGTVADLSSGTTTVTASQSPVSGFSNTAVSYSLTGLNPDTTYYYKVSATNSGGTTTGDIVSFATTSSPSSSSSSSSSNSSSSVAVESIRQALTVSGAGGGTVNAADNKANIVVEGNNTITNNLFFWLAPRTNADVLAGNSVAGNVTNIPTAVLNSSTSKIYELDPSNLSTGQHITTLSKPVIMTLDVNNLNNVQIYFYDPVAKNWSLLNVPIVTNSINNTASFVTQKAGLYVAVSGNPPQEISQNIAFPQENKSTPSAEIGNPTPVPTKIPVKTFQTINFINSKMADFRMGIINVTQTGNTLFKDVGSKIAGIIPFKDIFNQNKSDKVLAANTVDIINLIKNGPINHLGIMLANLGNSFIFNPTQISNVKVIASTPTSMTVAWKTNNPATSKVNYGETLDFGNDIQSNERVTDHKITIKNLKPGTTYVYEVMSQGTRYVYDAHHTFTTPKE
jgi:hypothetical protein